MCAVFGAYCADIDSVGALALIARDLELVEFLDMRVLQVLLRLAAKSGRSRKGSRGRAIPAPGTYGESVIEAPTSSHAAKAAVSFDRIEQLYPNVPNIELNRRGRRGRAGTHGAQRPRIEAPRPSSHRLRAR
jgi:hypothetical protein